jgi:hypothetical protein
MSLSTLQDAVPSKELAALNKMDRLQEAIDELEKTSVVFGEKLSRVVSPPTKADSVEKSINAEPPQSPLGLMLSDKTMQIRNITARIQDLIGRLEI